jgi:integrase
MGFLIKRTLKKRLKVATMPKLAERLTDIKIKNAKPMHPLSGHGEFVFQGGHDPKKPMSAAAINAVLKRMGYDTQQDITAHGFRAMARTILHERLNIDPYIIEHQLAHKVPDALGAAYNRTKFIEQRTAMMQAWADYLDELKAGAKVISLHGKSA